MRLVLLLLLTGCAHSWSYAHPADWGGTCATGQRQSPIDLPAGAEGAPIAKLEWTSVRATASHKGHTVQWDVEPLAHLGELKLAQFHYHVPSEHTFGGKHWPMEIHFVHVDAEGKPAAVVALFADQSDGPAEEGAARMLSLLAQRLPQEGERVEVGVIDVGRFRAPGYLAYDGSLTVPPCSEGIRWYVPASQVIAIPAEDLHAFTSVPHLAGTDRPTQPLHGRTISR